MPNTDWSRLTPLQMGQYAEYYAKMEFASYGLDVYTSEVDDHGVDFVVKDKSGTFYEIQVKSMLKTSYVFIAKDKAVVDERHLVSLLCFKDGELPDFYVFPMTVWKNPNEVFKDRANYDKPEWGINYSKKNAHLLDPYRAERILPKLAESVF